MPHMDNFSNFVLSIISMLLIYCIERLSACSFVHVVYLGTLHVAKE